MSAPPFSPGATKAAVTDWLPNDTEVILGTPGRIGLTTKLRDTGLASAKLLSPVDEAVIVQVPTAMMLTTPVEAFTEHTAVVSEE